MKQNTAYTRRLRQSRKSAMVALFAMLFQILFTMEHVSAMAVAAASGGANGTPVGFLNICTAEGLQRIPTPAGYGLDEQKTAPRSSGGESCSVCGSAAVSGASNQTATGPVVTQPHLLGVATIPVADGANLSSGFKRSGTTRGPPVC